MPGGRVRHDRTAPGPGLRALTPQRTRGFDEVFRQEWARAVAIIARATGDLDLAEDAVQDAFATALTRWPRDGTPQNPAGWIVTVARNRALDLLRRARVQTRVLEQRARLDAATLMVAQLAHEVRNPVASLRNLLELIRRRSADDRETTEYADLAIDELLRMHELAERMLDLNRPSAGAPGPANPFRVASDVALLSTIGSPRDEVCVTGDQDAMADIGGDALKQVLLNLVQNAREAMRAAGRTDGRAYIDVRRESDRVTVVVRDDGPGIAPEVLPRVFDPFVTTKERVHGVGLGLYVAESAIRAAGGTIGACNQPEGGARFTIELRMAASASAP